MARSKFSEADKQQVDQWQRRLTQTGLSKKELANKSSLSPSLVYKTLSGRLAITEKTRARFDAVLSAERRLGYAWPSWGGYARAEVENYINTFVAVRVQFEDPHTLEAFQLDIDWDEQAGGLIFKEDKHSKLKHKHQGQVWIPKVGGHAYLLTTAVAQARVAIVSRLNEGDTQMEGAFVTLYTPYHHAYVPASTPIVIMKTNNIEQESFGRITPDGDGDPIRIANYWRYLSALKLAAKSSTKIVVPELS
jgi:hypothetical protein